MKTEINCCKNRNKLTEQSRNKSIYLMPMGSLPCWPDKLKMGSTLIFSVFCHWDSGILKKNINFLFALNMHIAQVLFFNSLHLFRQLLPLLTITHRLI